MLASSSIGTTISWYIICWLASGPNTLSKKKLLLGILSSGLVRNWTSRPLASRPVNTTIGEFSFSSRSLRSLTQSQTYVNIFLFLQDIIVCIYIHSPATNYYLNISFLLARFLHSKLYF